MRALRLMSWQSEPQLVSDAPVPEAGPGQVVLKVAAAGACHSDLHIMYDFPAGMFPWGPPMTIGHENVGTVAQLGAGVTGFAIGDRVAVHGAWGCGACPPCQVGDDNYCENPFYAENSALAAGIGFDGGMAEYLLVRDSRWLVRVPDELDLVAAAPLTDAGLTPYAAVRMSQAKLTPGANVVVIGVGGLGHLGVQILSALTGAAITAVDAKPASLELATECGAHHTVLAGEGADVAGQVKELTKGRGAEVVLDFVGTDASIAQAISLGRARGDVTIVGAAGGTYGFGLYTAPYALSLRSTYWGTRSELQQVLALAALGKLKPIYTTYPLSDAMGAYRALHAGEVRGRAVVVPD